MRIVKNGVFSIALIITLLFGKALAGEIEKEKTISQADEPDLLVQAQIVLLKSAISLYNADRLSECVGLRNEGKKDSQTISAISKEFKETEQALKCSKKAFLTSLDLLVPKYIKEIPKINLNDKNWKGNNNNTWKIDKTTHTDILPSDIDGQTTWIFNPYYGNVMVNHKRYDINDFVESYISTAEKTKDIKSKLDYYTQAVELSNRYSPELKRIYGSSIFNAFIKRGNLYLNLKDYKKAMDDFLKAKEIAQLIDNKESILTSLISLSIVHNLTGDVKTSIGYLKEAIKIEPDLERKIEYGAFRLDDEQKETLRSIFDSIKMRILI